MSSSSLGNRSPQSHGTSSSGSDYDIHGKAHFGRSSYPPAFWEEKMARSYDVIKLLEHNPDLTLALHRCPTIAADMMKHPDVGREVAKDKKLATEIIRRPHLLKELANFHKYSHTQKRRKKIRQIVKALEEDYIKQHLHDAGGFALPLPMHQLEPSESDTSVAIGRATLPNIPGIDRNELPAINYLIKAQRMFLRHDVNLQHGCLKCRASKIGYYNVMNSHARLMYRIFYRHKQTGKSRFRPYELVVKDPDGNTLFVFVQMKECGVKHKLAVQYPKGNVIGYVEERHSCRIRPFLLIKNAEMEAMIQVDCTSRPFLSHFKYHPKFIFQLRAIGAHNIIGRISSEWIDAPPGAFPSERIYGVNFPQGLALNVKIIVMAAWMLVYRTYYDGKLEQYYHHTLTPDEKTIIRMVEVDEDDEQSKDMSVRASDSDEGKDEAIFAKYRRQFELSVRRANTKHHGHAHARNYIDVNMNAK